MAFIYWHKFWVMTKTVRSQIKRAEKISQSISDPRTFLHHKETAEVVRRSGINLGFIWDSVRHFLVLLTNYSPKNEQQVLTIHWVKNWDLLIFIYYFNISLSLHELKYIFKLIFHWSALVSVHEIDGMFLIGQEKRLSWPIKSWYYLIIIPIIGFIGFVKPADAKKTCIF